MTSREYYKVTYNGSSVSQEDLLDNDTEFNANQFKLYDDFTSELRINYNPLRNIIRGTTSAEFERTCNIKRRNGDPNDSGVDMENGNSHDDSVRNEPELLENEVMVDPWSSMDSSNSPLTDSGPSASDDCTPSTSDPLSPVSPLTRPSHLKQKPAVPPNKPITDKARPRNLTLDLDSLEPDTSRRPHFLDEDYQSPSKSNIECRIPKPHFLDHSPSPDEFDEKSDITNPNFLDDDISECDDAHKKSGALPKRPPRPTTASGLEERPRVTYRSTLEYGAAESAARSSERDKRASQLYRGTWPAWPERDAASLRSFSSNGSADTPRAAANNIESKMECVYSLLSLLTLSPDNNADLSGPLLEMSRSVESCIAMRQGGCIPLLVQLIHSNLPRETRDRAAKALRNIIHTQTDDKAGRREARVWRLLEQVREYCYALEDVVEARKEGKEAIEEDSAKHPSQSVAALMKLSFDEEHRHVVCALGGLPALAALVSGDQAAHGARAADPVCLTMRKYAGMTLTNLTFGDGNNKSLLCSFKDFMMALVDQLESPNDDMRQVTAAVLRNLSWRADTNSKQVLREVGAVKGLTQAAMTCQKEATLKSVLSALWNLTAHCSMNKVALCSVDGALGFLVDMLSYNSPTKTLAIIENAGGIMRNVSSHIAVREDYREILRERNCLSVLLQHLKSPSLTVVSNSCGTLWNLSARCPQDQQFLWDHGAVPMLRSLIHSKHKMIAMGSSAALKNLLNSKPGKLSIVNLDATARNMNLPALPTLGVRKQKALEQELDQNLAETCDNIEPVTSPSTSNREEKNLERQIVMNLERQRMSSSSPLMGSLSSQMSLSQSAQLGGCRSCSGSLLRRAAQRCDSRDSVASAASDTAAAAATGKVPVPTPRNKDLVNSEIGSDGFKVPSKPRELARFPSQPPVPPPRSSTDLRTNYAESGYDVDQEACDQPIDFSQKYSETKSADAPATPTETKPKPKKGKKEFGDYQETDLDQPTDYSLRYTEFQSETGSDTSEPAGPSVNEDTIKHFATEGTPYETPVVFSTATSMSDLRVIGKDKRDDTKPKPAPKESQIMTHSDEKDTCSIEELPRSDNRSNETTSKKVAESEKPRSSVFDTKFSSGMISPEKPVQYCDEGTPGYFSRVSSLSSLGEPTEEDCLAKKNAMATISVDPHLEDVASAKDKDGSKAVTFASEPVTPAPPSPPQFVEETPLMFSRSSSLGSLPEAEHHTDQGSVMSEVSRLTSGCMSPSELPDSPGHSVPFTPPRRPELHPLPTDTPEEVEGGERSVFAERARTWMVEHTPAIVSGATSLSSLTIDDDTRASLKAFSRSVSNAPSHSDTQRRLDIRMGAESVSCNSHDDQKGQFTDSCKVYLTEDTPAILSKAGSNSNLSVLSIISSPNINNNDNSLQQVDNSYRQEDNSFQQVENNCQEQDNSLQQVNERYQQNANDSSDSSNLSDAADLLEECIQKGIANVTKVKGPPSNSGSADTYIHRDEATYRASSAAASVSAIALSDQSESPPPLPPRMPRLPSDPKPAIRLPEKSREVTSLMTRGDSLSSLSADSFGSTDRELFQQAVEAGCQTRPAPRPAHTARHAHPPRHRSLDRSHKITHTGHRTRDAHFERNVAAGAYNLKSPVKRLESDFRPTNLSKSTHAYYGDRDPFAGYYTRRGHSSRYFEDGPPSLPARIDAKLDRSNSLSSLSNDSFGSTDKEVFERCVKIGMSKAMMRKKEDKRPRSDDRLEARDHRPRRRRGEPPAPLTAPVPNALERMAGDEYRKERTLLEELIARGAGEPRPAPPAPAPLTATPPALTKNVPRPPAPARAGGTAPARARPADPPPPPPPPHHHMDTSNECMAPVSADTTLLSEESKDDLERSNESYADIFNTSVGDVKCEMATLTRKTKPEWVDIKNMEREDAMKRSADTWNDNTCPDDVTFPTLSGSVHLVSSIRSEVVDGVNALPDLLEKSAHKNLFSKPDLTNKLELSDSTKATESLLENVPEPSFTSIIDVEHRFDSIADEIGQEASRLAAQLTTTNFVMETSVTSLTSLDLDNVRPPSNLGSLLSLSASGQFEDTSATSKKSNRSRKKSLPVAIMVKRALSNSFHQGSSEHLDSQPHSFLDNVKPPSEMEHIDMESSIISVSSIASEIADIRDKTPIVFDFKQPVQEFPMCATLTTVMQDLDKVNPPSLFDEIAESTVEFEQTTAHQLYDDCISNTLNVVTDIPSGSENCTPIPSDMSSVESTPKRTRNPKYLTAKEKRLVAKDRYQTYTITDVMADDDAVTVTETESEQFLTWTRSESDSRSDEYVTATSQAKSKRRVSAKQRRQEDRARYQTQTVDVQAVLKRDTDEKPIDPQIENLKQRLEAKRTMRQKRIEDAERFRTRTLSEDIPPSPTFVTKDASFENVESTTGYDSLSSSEPGHQQLADEPRDADSGHDDGPGLGPDTGLGPGLVARNNRRNCVPPALSDSEPECQALAPVPALAAPAPARPKITKPGLAREDSLDSNDSRDNSLEGPKAVRGRKKALYVSPYRRSVPPAKKVTPVTETLKTTRAPSTKNTANPSKIYGSKTNTRTITKAPTAASSPKKSAPLSPPNRAVRGLPLQRQGTFTKEESSVSSAPPDKRPAAAAPSRGAKPATPTANTNTSPSRLPQLSRYARPQLRKTNSNEGKAAASAKKPNRCSAPAIRASASNHSLAPASVAATATAVAARAKDVESKIAGLWKRVEQAKKQPNKPDKRVWIESSPEPPKLIRSSTFDGQPQPQVSAAPKQKTTIGLTQIPQPKTGKPVSQISAVGAARKPTATTRAVFARKQVNGQS